MFWPATAAPGKRVRIIDLVCCMAHGHLQVEPASLETKMLSEPLFATPTKIRGVAGPFLPEVESNVTQANPWMSLLYPVVSVGSAT